MSRQTVADAEVRAFIADCNLRRRGWDGFQRSARRSAIRALRNLDREVDVPRYEARTVEADPAADRRNAKHPPAAR